MLNFKKGGLFSRRSDATAPDEPNSGAQMLAVWGSPGCGKTTVAVKLVKPRRLILSSTSAVRAAPWRAKHREIICPSSDLEDNRSLSSILAGNSITETLVKHNCNTHKRMGHLAIIGLCKGENENSFPEVTPQLVGQLLEVLRDMADHIVIDCSSHLFFDELSALSILEADAVLRLMNCDLKSVSYLSSQQEYLKMGGFDFDKLYKAVSNVKPNEASEHMEQVLGKAVFTVPHSPELEAQVLAGTLLADLGLKDSRGFRKEIEKISKEVFKV